LTGVFWALQGFVMVFFMAAATVGLAGWCCALVLEARDADAGRQKPVSIYEIQAARQKAPDALMQHYLDLVHSVLSLPATKDAAADREVREAVTALVVAVEALPPDPKVVADDPAALRAEAETQWSRAQAEGDAVIAASLRRRAESLRRRADTAARTLLLLRRNGALREEVGEQIHALQTSLTALQVGGRQSVPELSGLAASIHRVALEANAVTVARAEVDTLLSRPTTEEARATGPTPQNPEEPNRLRRISR